MSERHPPVPPPTRDDLELLAEIRDAVETVDPVPPGLSDRCAALADDAREAGQR